jgi:hypothetical protein
VLLLTALVPRLRWNNDKAPRPVDEPRFKVGRPIIDKDPAIRDRLILCHSHLGGRHMDTTPLQLL